ncbi:MAG: winged helix DNA-binding domain-containing protein, partial [Streptococcaceae bacterium]|nr:winged helix DNA-binding domain-containing protein [Streptococcaceae bacterium]
ISARQDETFLSSYYFGQKETSLKIIEDLTLLFAQRKRLSKPEIEDFIHQNFPEFSFESNATALYGILQSMTHQGLIYFDASKPHANYELISADKSVLQNAEQAIEELILRYLKGFTPAGLKDFVKWSGIRIARARKIWKKLELNEEEPVLLSSMERQSLLEKIEKETIISARFDSLLTGYEDKTWLTPENRIADMWTKNGLLMAPIIYDGQLVGKWYYKVTGNPITFLIDHWLPLNKGQLEEKLLPVAEFLKVQIKEIKYTEI